MQRRGGNLNMENVSLQLKRNPVVISILFPDEFTTNTCTCDKNEGNDRQT